MKKKLIITRLERFAVGKDDQDREYFIPQSVVLTTPLIYHGATVVATVQDNSVPGRLPIAQEVELVSEALR